MSASTKRPVATKLPPHANAEVHKKIMRDLGQMSPSQIVQTAVDAGIYTSDGKLTKHYAPGSKR